MRKEVNAKVPIWEKYLLSIPEASEYFGIGAAKLRQVVSANPSADYVFWNGSRAMIKRKILEQYIDEDLFAM